MGDRRLGGTGESVSPRDNTSLERNSNTGIQIGNNIMRYGGSALTRFNFRFNFLSSDIARRVERVISVVGGLRKETRCTKKKNVH